MKTAAIPHRQDADLVEQHRSLRHKHDTLAQQHAVELKLAEALGSGGRFSELFTIVAQLSARPIWLLTVDGSVAMSSQVPDDLPPPDLTDGIAGTDHDARCHILFGPVSPRGIRRRQLAAQIRYGDANLGWLVMAEMTRPFGKFDRYLIERAALYLARHHRLHQAVRESITDLGSDLADRLLKGADRSDALRSDADLIGIDLDADKIVVCLDDSAVRDGIGSGAALAHRIGARLNGSVIGTRTHTGITLIVSTEPIGVSDHGVVIDRLKQVILAVIPGDDVQVGISSSRPADHLTDAYVEATEVISCLERFPARHSRVVTARELGPARVLVANGNIGSIRRYVRHTLGPLWDGSAEDRALLSTLAAFVRSGHNVRRTARALAVHENTVRLRIAKVRKLTGLDVLTDPSDQLAAHTALTIVTLRSRPHPVTELDDVGEATAVRISDRTA
ncbi:PucR family transcriptional regulator [Gordonia paraffinivorans]|uniref:PucR family transcriptional regulator n=1 Tax=Gordonia paraffinivorans TaxID=175628 RepID=UPI001C92F113|nr:PucR family transcriptional regulator [Gordonia paraffinivorans]